MNASSISSLIHLGQLVAQCFQSVGHLPHDAGGRLIVDEPLEVADGLRTLDSRPQQGIELPDNHAVPHGTS